jgi:predicted acyltransferase
VLSIDALRGFDMFWIIGGGTLLESLVEVWDSPITRGLHTQLTHVQWEGFHFEDLIFPLFVFVVGAVLPFSISRRVEQGHHRSRILVRIIQRTAGLLLLGLILNGLLHFDWATMRWPGVLQRIALCYFCAALLVLYTSWRVQAIAVPVILLGYWAVTMWVAAPGCQAGDLTMKGCLSSYIDQHLIPGSLYYKYGDNEGILSTLPAICTALLGALAGHWLRSERTGSRKAAGLALAGAVCLALGSIWGHFPPAIGILRNISYGLIPSPAPLLLLALYCSITGRKKPAKVSTLTAVVLPIIGVALLLGIKATRYHSFPIIKILWTSSYVLFAGGWSLLLLALFYWVIDVKGYRRWSFFFVVIGMNAITIYFLQNVIEFERIAEFFLHGLATRAGLYKSLLLISGALAARWLFLWFLYRHKIFLRV